MTPVLRTQCAYVQGAIQEERAARSGGRTAGRQGGVTTESAHSTHRKVLDVQCFNPTPRLNPLQRKTEDATGHNIRPGWNQLYETGVIGTSFYHGST